MSFIASAEVKNYLPFPSGPLIRFISFKMLIETAAFNSWKVLNVKGTPQLPCYCVLRNLPWFLPKFFFEI